ncbi:MAG: TIGR01777 family oxidoreductase [bacterium]
MKILVSGASGLVGSALVPALIAGGHSVVRLVRSAPKNGADEVMWDPAAGTLDASSVEGVNAAVHLSGENIGEGRWTPRKKTIIRDSRVKSTRLLAETLARLGRPPGVLVCASAVGYYGDRGEEVLREESPAGTGFLADTCREWESAAEPAVQKGIRVVHLRSGIVLSPKGGALAKMLPPFKMGLGGKLGSGRQYMSWISLDDMIGVIIHGIETEALSGPVNVVAPQSVTNLEFTKTLGQVLSRPTPFALPAFMVRLAFGEMADAALLASTRVVPARLQNSGYAFLHTELKGALRHVLGK